MIISLYLVCERLLTTVGTIVKGLNNPRCLLNKVQTLPQAKNKESPLRTYALLFTSTALLIVFLPMTVPVSASNPYVRIDQIYKQTDGATTFVYVRWTLLQKWNSQIVAVYPSINGNLSDNTILERSLGSNLEQGEYMWKPVGGICNTAGPGPEDYSVGNQYTTRFSRFFDISSSAFVNATDILSSTDIRFTMFQRTLFESSPCNMESKTATPDSQNYHLTETPIENHPPNIPSNVNQHMLFDSAVIIEGGTTLERAVTFKGIVSDPDGEAVSLQVELRKSTEPFTGVPTFETGLAGSGAQVSYTYIGLVTANYKWAYRAMDARGALSNWVEFGSVGNTDFSKIEASNTFVSIDQVFKQTDAGTTYIYVKWTLLRKWSSDAAAVYISLNDNMPNITLSSHFEPALMGERFITYEGFQSLGLNLDQGNYIWKRVGSPCNTAGPGSEDYTEGQQYTTRFAKAFDMSTFSFVNATDITPASNIRFTTYTRTHFNASPCNMDFRPATPDSTDYHVQQPCTSPVIATQPVSQAIMAGETVTLSVVASGSSPLHYQWFQGDMGDISNPVLGATLNTYTTPVLSRSRNYWARISNGCGTVYSITAIITVQEPVPVIFIPGIMGSEIGYGTTFTKLWPEVGHPGDKIQDLRKQPDGTDVKDNVRAGDVIRKVDIVRGLFSISVYESFIRRMISAGYQENASDGLFVFPYDWRDSVIDSAYLRPRFSGRAGNLKNKIEDVITTTGASKVDIVAHSMGGLVALEYLRSSVQHGRPHHIRNLITVATPFLGSANAFQALRYGRPLDGWGRLLLNSKNSKSIAHNIPGTYDLLPSKLYFDAIAPYGAARYILDPDDADQDGNRRPLTYEDTHHFLESAPEQFNVLPDEYYQDSSFPVLHSALLNRSNLFHAALDEFARNLPSDVSLYTITGWGQLTNRLYVDLIDIFGNSPYVHTIADGTGDGTVPLWSSSWALGKQRYYINLKDRVVNGDLLKHDKLLSDKCIQDVIVGILKNQSSGVGSDCVPFVKLSPPNPDEVAPPVWSIEIFSPADLHLVDNEGRHTGPLPGGTFEEQVPQSSYEQEEDTGVEVLHFVPSDGQTLRIVSTGTGVFDLKIHETLSNATVRTLIYRKVPIQNHTQGTLQPAWGALEPALQLDIDGNGTTDVLISPLQIFEGADPREVIIDVMLGSTTNPVNLHSNGIIPVAILSTSHFNAQDIEPLSVRFGRGRALEAHNRGHLEDVNRDGKVDMVLHFLIQRSGIQPNDNAICLVGQTRNGVLFQGCDAIRIVQQ